jgi:hypothetical protein
VVVLANRDARRRLAHSANGVGSRGAWIMSGRRAARPAPAPDVAETRRGAQSACVVNAERDARAAAERVAATA